MSRAVDQEDQTEQEDERKHQKAWNQLVRYGAGWFILTFGGTLVLNSVFGADKVSPCCVGPTIATLYVLKIIVSGRNPVKVADDAAGVYVREISSMENRWG